MFKWLSCITLVLAATCALAGDAAQEPKPLQVLLVCGGCCHDYNKQKDLLSAGLEARVNCKVTVHYEPSKATNVALPLYENADWAKPYDVVIHDECFADVKSLEFVEKILKPHKDGVPAVHLHCSMHSYRTEGWPKKVTPWYEFTGLQTTGHGPQLPIAITYTDKEHPITKGLEDWTTIKEELYNNTAGKVEDTAKVLAKGKQADKEAIVAWVNTYAGKTRVFGTTLGHNNDTVGDPRYLDLIARGLLWSCDKLNDTYLKPAAK